MIILNLTGKKNNISTQLHGLCSLNLFMSQFLVFHLNLHVGPTCVSVPSVNYKCGSIYLVFSTIPKRPIQLQEWVNTVQTQLQLVEETVRTSKQKSYWLALEARGILIHPLGVASWFIVSLRFEIEQGKVTGDMVTSFLLFYAHSVCALCIVGHIIVNWIQCKRYAKRASSIHEFKLACKITLGRRRLTLES